MIVRVDVGAIPPVVEVLEPENLTELKTVVAVGDHTWIQPDVLRPPDADPALDDGLAAMIRYADQHGWVDESGRVRAHVEIEHPGSSTTPSSAPPAPDKDRS